MSGNDLRAQAAANEPEAAKGASKSAASPTARSAEPAHSHAPAAGLRDPLAAAGESAPKGPPLDLRMAGAPWHVRHARRAKIALAVAVLAAAPFAYLQLKELFGPDPLTGIKLEGAQINPLGDVPVVARPAETTRETPVRPIAPAPKAVAARAAPTAPASGVTHTRPEATAGTPAADLPKAAAEAASPPAACSEAVAALGLCTPNPTGKGNR